MLVRAAPWSCLIFSGVVQALIAPPLNFWVLHPFALAPGFFVLIRARGWRAFLSGWLMGASSNLAIFYWLVPTIRAFSNIPAFGAVCALGVFSLVFGLYVGLFAVCAAPLRRASGRFWPVALAALFVALEFVNPQLFPYYQGVAWYQVPRLFLASAFAGVSLLSFLVVLGNLLIAGWLERRTGGAAGVPLRASSLVFATLLVTSLGLAHYRLAEVTRAEQGAPEFTVALVQANITAAEHKQMIRSSWSAPAEAHLELARGALERHPDVDAFVFPEGALRRPPTWPENRVLQEFVREKKVEIWTGGSDVRTPPGEPYRVYNSAWRLFGDGRAEAPYDKTILLPFGEFMPGLELFPWLGRIQGVGRVAPGTGITTYEGPEGTRFCFLICYEAIHSGYVRGAAQRGVELLVNITYDGWFGDTACLSQHLMLSAIQAAQFGVPLVRAATTGISAVTDARGVIIAQTTPNAREVLVQDVKKVHVPSFYALAGDWFAWACTGTSALLLALSIRRRNGQI